MSRKARKKSDLSKQDPKIFIANNIANIFNIRAYIDLIRETGSPDSIRRLADAALNNPVTRRSMMMIGPSDYEVLYRNILPKTVTIDNELIWVAHIIKRNSKTINEFLTVEKSFRKAIFSGNYSEAIEKIDEIEEKFGKSVWLIENRILTFEQASMLIQKNDYANSVMETKNSFFPNILALLFLARNEAGNSSGKFKSLYSNFMEPFNLPPRLEAFFYFHCFRDSTDDYENLSDLLTQSSNTSLIDLYFTFIYVLKRITTRDSGLSREIYDQLKNCLMEVRQINDDRLEYIFRLYGIIENKSEHASIYRMYDEKGNYDDLIVKLSNNIFDGSATGKDIEDYAKALQYAEHKPRVSDFIDNIIRILTGIYARDDSSEVLYADLLKISLNSHYMPEIAYLKACIDQHIFKEASKLRLSYLEKSLNSPMGKDRINYDSDIYSGSFVVEINYENDHLKMLHYLLLNRKYSELEVALENNKDLTNIQKELSHIKFECLIEMDRLDEAIMLLSEIFINDAAFIGFIPISRLLQGHRLRHFSKLRAEVVLPIAYSLYYRLIGAEDSLNFLRWATDDFVAANGWSVPSEIINNKNMKHEYVVYFLNSICIPEILESCRSIKDQREVNNERINICNILIQIDPMNSERYIEEIRQITTKMVTEEGVNLMETNRVYVNTRAIKSWADRDMKEVYARYMSSANNGDVFKTFRAVKALVDQIANDIDNVNNEKLKLFLQEQESDGLLGKMILDMQRKYYNDPEYGFISFLSTRIRHGKISNTLRGPLEDRFIVTMRSDEGQPYKDNTHWINKLTGLVSLDKARAVGSLLAAFSEKFDNLIENELKPRLHLRSNENPIGFFGTRISRKDINTIKNNIAEFQNFDKFIEDSILLFNSILDLELKSFRYYISNEFIKSVETLFENLLRDLNAILADYLTVELRNEINNAETDLLNTIHSVENWFHLDDLSRTSRKYTLDQVMAISVKAAARSMRSFNPELNTECSGIVALGYRALNLFSDIIFIILENIHKWSGINDGVKVDVIAKYNNDTHFIELSVTNDISLEKLNDVTLYKLEQIKQAVNTREYLNHAPKEGGSGLMKIRNLIGSAGGNGMEFGFDDNNKFYVHLKLNVKGYIQ